MALPGRLTEEEIRIQPEVWARTLDALPVHHARLLDIWRVAPAHRLLLTGCGSSYYLALSAAHVLHGSLNAPCVAVPSSEILFADRAAYWSSRPPLVVAISRSGETTETVWALERLQGWGATTVALTCHEGGALARRSDVAIRVPVRERSVVMTASFTSMLLALAAVGATLSGDMKTMDLLRQAPELAAGQLGALVDHATAAAGSPGGMYAFLGSGALFGLACEGALKMTEMALVPGSAYHTLEFLHGPKAALSSQMVIVGLLSRAGAPYEARVLAHLAALEARVVVVGERVGELTAVPLPAEPGTVPAILLAAVWLQLLALMVARHRGVEPDTPRFLDPVVTWDASLQIGGAR